MWKKRRGLWVVDDGKPTVDRPHGITIAVGVLPLVLSACAIYVSVQSLRTSERTSKIANRAYVGLVSGKLQFSNYGIVGGDGPGGLIVRMDLSARIQNAGNSPAREGRFMAKYKLPPGWGDAPAYLKRNLTRDCRHLLDRNPA
jgi:hypothetical protein